MRRIVLCLLVCSLLTACTVGIARRDDLTPVAPTTPTSTPTMLTDIATAAPPTPVTLNSAPEVAVLTTVIANVTDLWWSPRLAVDESNLSATSYRAVQILMAGADEYAEIVCYPTAAEAQASFGAADGLFHDLPSRQGRTSGSEYGHYQDARWTAWLSGARIYRAQTEYNSTYAGEARDPAQIAEVLYQAAVDYGLIP